MKKLDLTTKQIKLIGFLGQSNFKDVDIIKDIDKKTV